MSPHALVADRFRFGWYFADEKRVCLDDDPDLGPWQPVAYGDGEPVYAPHSPATAIPTIVCPRCMEPSSYVTRHAVERHGDEDVEILPAVRPDYRPPDWFQPDWI